MALFKLIDLLIPYVDYNNGYKTELKLVKDNSSYFFEGDNYRYANRPTLKKNNRDLGKYVFYDLLSSDQFFIPLKIITDKEKLWHWLSVFVGNNNLNHLRQRITDMVYDENYFFDLTKASKVFDGSGFCLYYIILNEDKAIGLTQEDKMDSLIDIWKRSRS